jgi:hypothetical protein
VSDDYVVLDDVELKVKRVNFVSFVFSSRIINGKIHYVQQCLCLKNRRGRMLDVFSDGEKKRYM